MVYTSRPQEMSPKSAAYYSPKNSPRSNGTNTNPNPTANSTVCSSSTSASQVQIPTTPNLSTPRSDPNPCPTTFVQADTTNFKHVVQMLTGSSDTVSHQSSAASPKSTTPHHHHHPPQDPTTTKNFNIPPVKTTAPKKQGFKLYERRSTNLKNTLMINTLLPNFPHQKASGFSPRHYQEILSPSLLDFPSLTLSPVTPLNDDDPFDKSASSPSLGNSSSEEDRAIAEKGFYLHPSPRTAEPRLLPLFPTTSPRVSSGTSS